ncbi:MAG: hypothetical protein H7Z13_01480 [Ferruginibacter sp.]|nr:hypothetical protein [Ferruginibacter sp.]
MKLAGLLLFIFPLTLFGQDLTGTWIGRGGGTPYLKMVIVQMGDSCYGYTYDEGPGFCKANFAGKFSGEKQKLKGRGTSFIAKSFFHSLAVYHLSYSKNEGSEYLNGLLWARGAGAVVLSLGIPSFAQLKKITNVVDTTLFMSGRIIDFNNRLNFADTLLPVVQREDPAVIKEKDQVVENSKKYYARTIEAEKQERVSELVETIYTNADTVKLILYDNGVVDDDTVTVFFDNVVILDRYRITEKAKELFIPLIKNGQSHIVELFANNLGTIPPNTALIIIETGSDRYEVHASYSFSTNAKIIFNYKE